MSDPPPSLKYVERALRVLIRGYYFCFSIYVALGTATVALPGISATGLVENSTAKVLSGLGALAGVIFAFLKPHENATAYDAAATAAWKVAVSARMGQMSAADAAIHLGQAIEKTN